MTKQKPLTPEEIVDACKGFLARGAKAQGAVDRATRRCVCGHISAAHSHFYETNLSMACTHEGCGCYEFQELRE